MKEKLIIEIDDDKIKYAVFQIDEKFDYQLISKKISYNAGINKGKISDFDYTAKIINDDLHGIEKEVDNLSIERLKNKRDEGEKEHNKFKFKFFKFIKLYDVRSIIFPYKYEQPKVQPEFKKILELTKGLTLKNNQKLFFIYLPSYNRYKVDYKD